jgi:hypothetical protein
MRSAHSLPGCHDSARHLSERHFYAGTLLEAPEIICPRVGELYTFRATVELHLALADEVALTVTAFLVEELGLGEDDMNVFRRERAISDKSKRWMWMQVRLDPDDNRGKQADVRCTSVEFE